uniref:Reelin domain-containing protein n=1 Tax=Leptocylindrus danicus TaxID=163516 RepID=A0A7S2PKH1_9STRA|mmetsp:Transcript_4934/g.7207  ORF Transcript_4934/g.7207 Transcript_4934/m.7207 type:complete len:315 (+) Transcript_4934:105-1049(+)
MKISNAKAHLFISTVVLLLLCSARYCRAEADGSETCHNTPGIPGKFHDNDPAGTLEDGGFEVLVDDQIMSLTNVNPLAAGQHSITVRTQGGNGGTFIGLWMWGNSDAALSASPDDTSVKGGNAWTVGKKDVTCDAGSSGLTHTGIESKTQSSGILTIPVSGTLEVQVQPMTEFTGGSTFFWSSLLFEATSKSPTNLPSISPTKSPVDAPVTQSPTMLPTKSPSTLPSSSPTWPVPTKKPSNKPTSIPAKSMSAAPSASPTTSAIRAQPSSSSLAAVDEFSSSSSTEDGASSIWAQVGVGAAVFVLGVLAKVYYF